MMIPPAAPLAPSRRHVLMTAAAVVVIPATTSLAEIELLKPAVPIRKSVTPDYLVCLEDGKKLKMLKRHLMTAYGMTPAQYRAKWKLGGDYPMVAANYAAQRSTLAKSIGLGRRAAAAPEPAPVAKPARRRGPAKKPAS